MKSNLIWLSMLAFAFAAGLFLWLTPAGRVGATGWSSLAPRTDRCVNPSGSGGCFSNIQAAINASSSGDLINVATGWYTEHITMANGVSIYGQGWSTGSGTVITGNFSANRPTVYIPWSVGASTILSGVQVAGGGTGDPNTSTYGGGIRINGGSPTIINTWANNNTGDSGGGVLVAGGSPSFNNVRAWNNRALVGGGFNLQYYAVVTITSDYAGTNGTVYQNSATSGGGFYIGGVTATLSGLRIYSNTAQSGGGMYISSQRRVTLQSNDISLNVAGLAGGGIRSFNSANLQIYDNWIRWNTANQEGGGLQADQSSGLLRGNLVQGNVLTSTISRGGGASFGGDVSTLTVERNLFQGNQAKWLGGGLFATSNMTAVINANAFVTNTAGSGGGIYVDTVNVLTATNNIVARNIVSDTKAGGIFITDTIAPKVINNTIADNDGDGVSFESSPGIIIVNNIVVWNHNRGIVRSGSDTYTANHNDVFGNTAGNYSNVGVGANDLSINPSFIAAGNIITYYHIQPNSPVRNTGFLNQAPTYDVDVEPRVGFTSMGADQVFFRILLPLNMR